jgi:hypothetical protein
MGRATEVAVASERAAFVARCAALQAAHAPAAVDAAHAREAAAADAALAVRGPPWWRERAI